LYRIFFKRKSKLIYKKIGELNIIDLIFILFLNITR